MDRTIALAHLFGIVVAIQTMMELYVWHKKAHLAVRTPNEQEKLNH